MNPYSVLGVDRGADQDTIRKAYKKLARTYHPDINRDDGAEDRFKEINAAYDVLGDGGKRKLFDEFGEASTRPGFDADAARAWKNGQGGRGGFDFGGGMGGVDMDDLLGSLFGSGMGGRPRRGADQQVEVTVPFMTTVLGGEVGVRMRRPDGGVESFDVPIPPGARDGGKVRLKGRGLPPRGGGPCGDLLVHLSVTPHPHLVRDGDDLILDVPITVHEAMAGARITVPTPTGDVKVTVPAGAKSGQRMRVKGRGVQRKGRPGNLYLVLRPTVPASEDPEVLAAAERLQSAYDGDVRGELRL